MDWKRLQAALQQSREGHNLQALALYSSLMPDAETDSDRAAIVFGEASCYSQLGNVAKASELLRSAKDYARADRIALSQVELSEASLFAQEKRYDVACEKFAAVKSEYQDLLVQDEHKWSWTPALGVRWWMQEDSAKRFRFLETSSSTINSKINNALKSSLAWP